MVLASATAALANHSIPGPTMTNATNMLNWVTLVPAHDPCSTPNQICWGPPLALPGCPPTPSSVLRFGATNPIGRGRIRIRKIGTATAPDVDIRVQLNNVQDPAGAFGQPGPFNGTLTAVFTLRSTAHDGPLGVPCSVVDTPFTWSFPCNNSCTVTTTMNTLVPQIVGPGKLRDLEIRDISVQDPAGKDFVRPGVFIQ